MIFASLRRNSRGPVTRFRLNLLFPERNAQDQEGTNMFSKFRHRAPIVALGIMLLTVAGLGAVIDETDPEITDRVARISHLIGDVDIRRADADESEKAVLNLPIIQGDVIVTGPGARFEIQFSSRKYLRVSENSQITITTLQE